MAAKQTPKGTALKKVAPKTSVQSSAHAENPKKSSFSIENGWLQDATLEVPASPAAPFAPGERELEFSIGMRQQEDGDLVRSEMRGRALVHAQGVVLALAEASYVVVCGASELPENLPQQLYTPLRGHLEALLALGGHTPPLPASLDKVE